ncbi:TetR/AcrR family transcriptional regulator [Zhongshania sp.]|uniref:TetR/AcrR family transcriptional regulator n=1 Tax=Zhongshania sp. TaxID=1971902 RepID=UPI003566FD1A
MPKKIFRPQFSTATDARVLQTRDALRRALLELLQHKSIEQLTIREIAASAGVGYTTFFRHHQSKEALLDDIAADEIKRLIEFALPSLDMENISSASLALCSYVADHRSLWTSLLTGGAAAKLREEFNRIALEIAAPEDHTGNWLPAEVGVIVVVSGTIELLTWWLRQSKPISVKQLAAIHERLIASPTVRANLPPAN